jgi:hypothetical protein
MDLSLLGFWSVPSAEATDLNEHIQGYLCFSLTILDEQEAG